jgi:cation transport regulator ChaC
MQFYKNCIGMHLGIKTGGEAMKTVVLEDVWAGYEVHRWLKANPGRLIRLAFNRKGAVVYYIPA